MKKTRILATAAGLAWAVVWLSARPASANCNVIPELVTEYHSVLGLIDRALVAPGERVAVRLDLGCRPGLTAFSSTGTYRVELRFEPPGAGPETTLVLATPPLAANCGDLTGARCDALLLTMPTPAELDAALPPAGDGRGLAGPASILVRDASTQALLAQIGPLFEPTRSCRDRVAEPLFQHFTVIPDPTPFAQLETGGEVLATLDGGGNLLIPVDFRSVLVEAPDSPLYRLLSASALLPAFPNDPTPIRIPDDAWLRSFTTGGRPIPPVLGALETGTGVFGSVDAPRSVLRLARFDPGNPAPGGIPLYDLSDRLFDQRGPIVIPAVQAQLRPAARLADLKATPDLLLSGVDERIDGVPLDGDGDSVDRVAFLTDLATGETRNLGVAPVEVSPGARATLALASGGSIAALALSERRQGSDQALPQFDGNLDGDAADGVLRIFDAQGDPLSDVLETVDPAPVVNGQPFLVSTNGQIFFRTREADQFATITDRASRPPAGFDGGSESTISPFDSGFRALSGDGHLVAFTSPSTNLVPGDGNGIRDLFVARRSFPLETRRIPDPPGAAEPNGESFAPSLSEDGAWMAFTSRATNISTPPGTVTGLVYVASVAPGASGDAVLISQTGGVGVPADGAVLSSDGRYVSFSSDAPALGQPGDGNGSSDVYVADRDTDGDQVFDDPGQTLIRRISIASDGTTADSASNEASISGDGRFVAFTSTSTNLVPGATGTQVYLHDRDTDADGVFDEPGAIETRLVSRAPGGPPGDAASRLPSISADSRFVSFDSDAGNLIEPPDADLRTDIFVWDRLSNAIERVSQNAAGEDSNASASDSSISGDGRFVAYGTTATNIVPGASGSPYVLVYDRLTDTPEAASRLLGVPASASQPSISPDGRSVAFTSGIPLTSDDDNSVDDVFVYGPDDGNDLDLNLDFDRDDTVARVFDPAFGFAIDGPAVSQMAVVDDLALVLVPEARQNSGDAENGDGDADDQVVWLLNSLGYFLNQIPIPVAATQVAVSQTSSGAACITVPEPGQGDTILNGDGDAVDDVLYTDTLSVLRIGESQFHSAGIAVGRIGALRGDCVALASEAAQQGSPLAISNGDSDANDSLLAIVRPDGSPRRVGPSAVDFVTDPTGTAIAFRTCESDEGDGGTDLNQDGDQSDCVMQLAVAPDFDPQDTGYASVPCTFPACDTFFEPYRVRADSVSFVVREADQSGPAAGRRPDGSVGGVGCLGSSQPGACDLTGDGDALDTVVVVFKLSSGGAQAFEVPADAPPQDVSPFPETVAARTAVRIESDERRAGQDCNGDGDLDDPCVLLVADSDEDGIFDESVSGPDNAPQLANPTQQDSDGDGLADLVDPNNGTPPLAACDTDRDGDVDQTDVSRIFADRGMAARAGDPRDPDADLRVTVLDAGRCVDQCTLPDCSSPPLRQACGLGFELALALLPLIAWRRRLGRNA